MEENREPHKSLKQKAASGMVWSALQRYSTMIIAFISGIILARLLTPYDYGCIGMLTIFMALAESFIDGGFGAALIQKKDPTPEDYSTIFYWNIGMAILMYAIIYISAPSIASFYNIPLLCRVLRVQALVFFVYAFNVVQRNHLQKTLNFKLLSITTLFSSLISLIVTIVMAYQGYGVWSLVAQNILVILLPATIFWFYVKWRPRAKFSWRSFKTLGGFGFYMLLTSILNQFSQQIQGLLIGKFFNASIMGYYTKAYRTENIASLSISQVMTQVTFPLYSEMQDDKEQLKLVIKRLAGILSYVTFPILFIMLLCAKPIFVLLYSERWLGSVPFFQILCIAGLAVCLQSVNLQAISAIGKGRTMAVSTIIKRTVGISAIVGGFFLFGLNGLLWGVVFNSWFSYLYNIYLVQKYIGFRCTEQLKDLFPVLFFSALVAIISYVCANQLQLENMYMDGIVKALFYIVLYCGGSLVLKPKEYVYCQSLVSSFLRKYSSKFK